jgi:signal transduction histidine kinase
LLEFPSFSSVRKNSEGLKVIEIKDPSDENRLKYVASAPVGEIGWSVIVERGRQEVLKAQFGFFIHIGVIALLTYSLFIFLFIYRRKRHDYLAQLRFLASELLEVQEKEKKRIAGELHDGIGQVLNFAGVAVKKALKKMPGEKALEAALGMIDTGIRDLRKLHQDLRPSLLDHAGLLTTIEWFCREYKSIYPGVQIKQQLDVSEEEIPEPLKIRIFRVVQEAMNNAAKHSNADSIIVSLKVADQRLELKIEDNGKGIDLESASQIGKGLGLISMKERVLLSGGEFKIRSERGKGTVILCLWPKHLSSNNLISAGP